MNGTTVTKGERFYTIAINGIVVAQAENAQGAADYLWAMNMGARWMIYHENLKSIPGGGFGDGHEKGLRKMTIQGRYIRDEGGIWFECVCAKDAQVALGIIRALSERADNLFKVSRKHCIENRQLREQLATEQEKVLTGSYAGSSEDAIRQQLAAAREASKKAYTEGWRAGRDFAVEGQRDTAANPCLGKDQIIP